MAQQGVVLDQDQFCCSVCLHLLQDPVTLACGHSYCSSCIEGCWDKDEQKGVYSCPHCRQSFTPRPVLKRNNMLAEVVEKLKETGGAQAAPSELSSPAGPGGVTCDLCDGPRKQKALKSCLVYMVSYCQTHLQPHYQVPGLKKHKLMEATSGLQEMICSSHDKLLEIFCRTDQQCICYLCTMDQHKGHDTVSVKDEREKIQDKLVLSQQEVQQRVQQREKELKEVQQAVESFKSSGQAAVEDSERIFTELIRSIETRRSEVKDLIQAQQRAAVSQAEGLLERLEQEIAELRKREAELEKLCHTENNIHFLQSYQSLSSTSVSPDVPHISDSPLQYFKQVTEEVSDLRDQLEETIQRKLFTSVPTVDVFLPPEPQTRADLLRYSCQLTLDPNTAHPFLFVSEENRKVARLKQKQLHSICSERFTHHCQVLCREALSGRCYWEVEKRGSCLDVAVSYNDVSRSGENSKFGYNDKSWRLVCSGGSYWFRRNKVITSVVGPQSSRIGVYLDHKAGTLSFYSVVSDTAILLHRVETTFIQPLHPGIYFGDHGISAEIMKLW